MDQICIDKKSAPLACAFIISLLGYLWVVWPGLYGPFLFDDFPNLENLRYISGQLTRENLGDYLVSFRGFPGRPIATLSFLINDFAWPSQPYSFKYTNVLIHLLNAVLLFGLLRQLAKHSKMLPASEWFPLLAMVAWMAHPLLLSSQFLAVQRMTLLSGTFSLAGLWLYVFLLPKTDSLPKAFGLLTLLATFTILALLSKENGALLPTLIWILQITLLNSLLDEKSISVKSFLNLGVAIPSICIFIYIVTLGLQPWAFNSRDFDLPERLMTQTHVLADYARIALLPRLSDSGIYHDDFTIIRQFTQSISTVLLSFVILSLILSAIAMRKKWPLICFAILWFFAGHSMESSFIALELYFEHRNYLPLIGPVVAITAAPFLAISYRKLAFGLLFLWLLALAGTSAIQSRMWGNWGLLATVWVTESPLSLRSAQELGSYYISINEPEKAIDAYLNGRQRGIQSAELPLAALLVSCQNSIPDEFNLLKESFIAIEDANYSNGLFSLLQNLRVASNNKSCPEMLSNEKWWRLSDAFLSNMKLRHGGEYFVRIERSRTAFEMNNSALGFQELHKAFRLNPTVELANKIAKAYIESGDLVEARRWLETGLNTKETTMQFLMSSQKRQSERLLDAIDRYEISTPQK
jgi:hypothetical protein